MRTARIPAPALGAAISIALGLAAVSCAPSGPPPKPHGVIVLLVDCLRFDHLGADGATRPYTPNLDRLAPAGVRFSDAFVVASWTRPSVPSLLTGLYPSEHGLTDFLENDKGVQGAVLSEDALTLAEGMKSAGYATALVGYQSQLSVRFGLAQGFDFYNNNTRGGEKIDTRFLGWLDEQRGQPFFAYLHYLDIHWPYCPPESTYGKLGPTAGVIDTCGNWRKLRDDIHSGAVKLTDADRAALAARYGESLMALDGEIGRLFAELEKRGLWDDTLIVLTGDHGEELAERGGIEHGHTLYDELLHVPFVFKLPSSWPAERGGTVRELVETRSLLPTLFDAARVARPERVSAPSLLPWLLGRGGEKPPIDFVASEANGMFAVRTREWKLIVTPAEKKSELYDLVHDPGETRNLAAESPPALAGLQDDLRRWRRTLKPLPTGKAALDDETVKGLRALGYIQ
ncbi:MAG: sulfatase [Thermoanaerobaculia bacterium]